MAINLMSTKDVATSGVKILIYGLSGVGKTTIIKTLSKVIVLSAEGGLLALQGEDVHFLEITDMDSLKEAYGWVYENPDYDSIALDSISEIAEVVLAAEKKKAKDPRAAYGAMQDQMNEIIRAFRDIPNKNVYFSAKLEKAQDEMGRILYSPSMPGNKMGQALPYFFDEVLALRAEKTDEGVVRMLQTVNDGVWAAKDRSGKLDEWEEPNLTNIINKIKGVN
jgi:phage nucleotide-binding protein